MSNLNQNEIFLASQCQLTNAAGNKLESESPILFNYTLLESNPYLQYDNLTGIFTINKRGLYFIKFEVILENNNTTTQFDILVDGQIYQSIYIPSNIETVSSSTIVFVPNNSSTIQITNGSAEEITFANIPIQANITIFQI